MASSGAHDPEWLGMIGKILEADTLLGSNTDEVLANELSSHVGFPFNEDQQQLDVYSFWEVLVKNLRANGYRIIDDIYIDTNDDEELKHRRKLIEEINRHVNK